MDTSELEIARSKRAAALLEQDGVFREAWRELDARIAEAWRVSPARDTEGRERLYMMGKAMRDLEAVLTGYVNDGAMALDRISQAERDDAAGF
jgi:hypothetical protein